MPENLRHPKMGSAITDAIRGYAFGLAFELPGPMPEFGASPLAESEPAHTPEAVRLRWHSAAAPPPAGPEHTWQDEGGQLHISVPAQGHIVVGHGHIDATPAVGRSESDLRPFVLGSAMGALLHLHGFLVFHGSAVLRPDGQAALFCGASTAGKSTLAASCAAQGYAALADDLCAVKIDSDSGHPLVLPGLARTKLWRDALERLHLQDGADDSTRVHPSLDKHCLPLPVAQQAARLAQVVELQVDETSKQELTMQPLWGVAKVTALLGQVYRPQFLQALGQQHRLLPALAAVAPHVQMHRITRPRRGDTLPAIMAWLQASWPPQSP